MKKVLILILFLCLGLGAWAVQNGSQWMYLGTGPNINGMGYSGIAGLEYSGSFFINPANPAFVHRFRTFGQLGIGSTYSVFDLGITAPLQVGNLSAAFQSINVAGGIGGVMSLQVGHSKMIKDNFAFGFSGYFINQISGAQSATGIGLNLGAVFRLNKVLTNQWGLGFSDTKWGIALSGLGLNAVLDTTTPLPGIKASTGLSSDILNIGLLKMGGNLDVLFLIYPFQVAADLGLKLTLADHFHLMGGVLYGTGGITGTTNGLANFTLGASFSWEFGETPVEIFYSYNPLNFTTGGAVHFLGAEIAFGLPDKKGPQTDLKFSNAKDQDLVYFSPNYDGSQDRVSMDLDIKDASLVKDWKLKVYNHQGDLVKTVNAQEEREVALTLGEFWKRLWAKKVAVAVPDKLEWDGTSDKGLILGDGEYTVRLESLDELKNPGESQAKTIRLDLTPPTAELGIDFKLFSPNGDGNQDSVEIRQTLSAGDMWRSEIRNSQGEIVRKWDLTNQPPAVVFWDGKDAKGTLLPDGSYDYIVYGSDLAGNRSILAINSIILNTKKQYIVLLPQASGFSPNADKRMDSMVFKAQLSDKDGLTDWDLVIKDAQGRAVRTIKGTTLPDSLVWDGKDDSGAAAPDGRYQAQLQARFANGNRPVSDPVEFLLDTHAPEVQYQSQPDLFSPDGDGENDMLELKLATSDSSKIKDWSLEIIDPDGKVFKRFSGNGTPAPVIQWDGRSDKGEPVESAQDYRVRLSISDELGNQIKDKEMPSIAVDVLVEATPRGLKIRISNIEFEFGKSAIKGKGYLILNRVAQILKKYKTYQVEISGHTDNVGTEDANLKLSKARAEAVMEYLISKGVSSKRLTTVGLGYQFPVEDNATEAGRRKNRRVEFILIKD